MLRVMVTSLVVSLACASRLVYSARPLVVEPRVGNIFTYSLQENFRIDSKYSRDYQNRFTYGGLERQSEAHIDWSAFRWTL